MKSIELIDEKSILEIYKRMDKNTPRNIEILQNRSIPSRNEFNIKDFRKDDRTFTADFNSKAEYIEFGNNVKYVKFYIPLNIFSERDLLPPEGFRSSDFLNQTDVNRYLTTSYKRGMENKNTIDVFLNGEKLPDSAVLLTVYHGMVDVYFQAFLLDEINEICFFIRENNSKFKYLNYTWIGSPRLVVSDYNFEERNIYSLYRNGQYMIYNEDYVIHDNIVEIIRNDYEEDDIYEIIREGSNLYCLDRSYYSISNLFDVHHMYRITETGKKVYLDTERQPISKNNVAIYIDGYRICNTDILALNGSFFKLLDYENKKDFNVYLTVKLNYSNEEQERRVNYKDNYSKINNLLDTNLIHRHLINKNTTIPHVFPKFFTVSQMISDYPPVYIENLVENPIKLSTDRRIFAEKAIESYIKINSHNISHFVKQFNQPEKVVFNLDINPRNLKNYVVTDTSGLPPYYYYDFKEERFLIIYKYDNENFAEKILIDDKLIPRDKYDIINIHSSKFIYYYVKMDIINPDSNVKLIIEEANHNYSLKNTFNTSIHTDAYVVDLDAIHMSILRYDLVKFFLQENKEYISLINNKDYILSIENNKLIFTIVNPDIQGKVIHYMNPFFAYRKDIKIGRNFVGEESYIIDVNDITDNSAGLYPRLSIVDLKANNLEIYYDGFKLINGVDFVVLEKTLYNSVYRNRILFNIKIEQNKVFSFVFKNRRETTILKEKEITSSYGLFYSNKIPYPIDTEYMDLYLDNVKLLDSEVQLIADNLIRIKDKNYLKYFAIISNVDLPESIIKYLSELKLFNKNSFEEFFSSLVKQLGDIDYIYELMNDKNLKEEDKIQTEDKRPNVEKCDLRLDTLFVNFDEGNINKLIDCNKGIDESDLSSNEIYNYFPEDAISLDANEDLIYKYATLSALENCYSNIMISELFGLERDNDTEYVDGEIDDLANHPIYQYIYEENDIILDANQETPSTHIFDANDEELLEYEDEENDEEVEVIVFDSNLFI